MDSFNTDFFLVPAEYPLISVCDNMLRMDSVSMEFHLLQTTLPVPTLQTHWIQWTIWDNDHGQRTYVIVTAVLLIAASWEWPLLCRDYITTLDTRRRGRWQDLWYCH